MRPLTRRLLWAFAAVYLLLLLFSHVARRLHEPSLPEGASIVLVEQGEEKAFLAWRVWPRQNSGAPNDEIPVVLLHGSPGDGTNFSRLAPQLAERRDVLVPDLLGFGLSSRDAPDVSMKAQARALLRMFDDLKIEYAHVVGFSLGGGAALDLVDFAPERVASLTLLSAIGAQEYELLGNYEINRAVHAVQLAAITLLQEGVPHFGRWDDMMLDRGYARSFYETDQRPYRGILQQLETPLLILHGREDPLVPVEAAIEHHRLAPHSELAISDASHFMVFRSPGRLAAPMLDFFGRVERGEARTRSRAEPERLERSEQPLDPSSLPRAQGVTALVWILLLAAATWVSEDLTTISAGLLVGQGRLGWTAAIFACFLGIFVGDLLLFLAGRFLGRPWLKRRPLSYFLDEAKIETASKWLDRRGPAVILLSRFTPGMRLPTYVAAGMLRTGFWRFTLWFAIAVALWTPLLVAVSAGVGKPALDALQARGLSPAFAFLALALILWLSIGLVHSLSTHRRRRLAVGKWKRRLLWEYWPRWMFYPPVIAWILALGIRYRSPTLFTLANPALPDGGFVGESKSDILSCLPQDAVARWRLLPAESSSEEKRRMIDDFLAENDLTLPVVIKPDVGQRGDGVTIVREEAQFEEVLDDRALIVQEFVDGPELGIFWIGRPDDERGRIFSVAEKRLIEVVGDGVKDLERLILDDARAVAMAPVFLRRHQERLREVPSAGEAVRLVDVGTHCRGALFVDGFEYLTPQLEVEVDRVSRAFEGFHLGRYDLRSSSWEDFQAGRFKVLELNGVTSEPAHIYDPKNGVLAAWRTIFEQWKLAFEIGAAHRSRGLRPPPAIEFLRSIRGALT